MAKFVLYVFKCWDRWNTMLPFILKVKLPKANKERIILKRDDFGRILAAQTLNYF